MKAFLVMFPRKEPSVFAQGQSTGYPDHRPTLVVAESISAVAEQNRSAIKIDEMDVSNVIVSVKDVLGCACCPRLGDKP